MTINADHSDLPRGDSRNWPPDAVPRFGQKLAEVWARQNEESFNKPTRLGTKGRVSMVGQCARSTSYYMLGIEQSEPPSLAENWVMGLGTMIHEALQPVLVEAFPGAGIEFPVDIRTDEMYPSDLSGSGDVVLDYVVEGEAGRKVVIEIKTIGGFGFKILVGARKGFGGVDESGPKYQQLTQGAVLAHAEGADELVMLYLSRENLSYAEMNKLGTDDVGRFLAEFTIPRDQYEPIAQAELKRQQFIMDEYVGKGALAPRAIVEPGFPKARVIDPSRGQWEERRTIGGNEVVSGAGQTWICGYCHYRSRCIADGES